MSSQNPDRDPQLFYELAKERHAAQADVLTSLDGKLVFYLSGSGALLGILVAVFALRPDAFGAWAYALTVASGAAWLLLTALALNAFQPKSWKAGPKLPQVFKLHSSEESDASLKWRVAKRFWNDYEENEWLEKRKVFALRWALWLFIAQTLLLVIALVLLALDHDSAASRRSLTPQWCSAHQIQTLAPAPEKCPAHRSAGLLRSSAEDPNDFLTPRAEPPALGSALARVERASRGRHEG